MTHVLISLLIMTHINIHVVCFEIICTDIAKNMFDLISGFMQSYTI